MYNPLRHEAVMQTGVLCCNALPCARNWVVEPSGIHDTAERSFRCAVQSICTTFTTDPPCLLVHGLHSCVLQGTVRRKAAAVAASSLHNVSYGDWSVTLVCILLGAKHNDDCACMEHVLSWGTCPTVTFGPRLDESKVTSFGIIDLNHCYGRLTAFGLLTTRHFRDEKWRRWTRLLLAHGSLPWRGCCIAVRHIGPCVTFFCSFPPSRGINNFQGDDLSLLQTQWWRWHARRARRLWLAGWP